MTADDLKIQNKFKEAIQHVLRPPLRSNFLIINRTSDYLAGLAENAANELGLSVKTFPLNLQGPYESFPSELKEEIASSKYPRAMGFFTYPKGTDWKQKETPARVELIHGTIKKTMMGYAHAPGIDKDMALDGPIQCDYQEMSQKAEKMLDLLEGVEKVKITAPAGTDIEIEIPSKLKWKTDCIITPPDVYGNPGNMGNLPVGEICIYRRGEVSVAGKNVDFPVKLTGSGTIVCDVCADNIDKLVDPERPITISVENGFLTDFSSEDEAFHVLNNEWKEREKKYVGLKTVLEELGIGINDKARVLGNLLETEKLARTVHLALGHVRSHSDFIVSEPTVILTYGDKTERALMEDGVLKLD